LKEGQIIYTGNGVTDGPMVITFATSTRPDKGMSFPGDFEIDTNYRVSQISAAVNGNTVRQYNLSYTTGNNGSRSLLSSIQENGWDDSSVETSLPAMTFGYVSSSTSFVSAVGSGTVSGDPYIAADVNGDGINDAVNVACNPSSGAENGYIYPDGGTGTTFTPPQVSTLCWSYGSNGTGSLNETGTRFLDVNANGKAEIVQGSYTGTTGTQVTGMYANNYATSSGYAWVATTTFTGVIPAFDSRSTSTAPYYTSGFFGDVNGDGLPDFELALSTSTTESSLNGLYIGNGSAWNGATTTIFAPAKYVPVGAADCTASQLIDVNGDGLADWVYTDGTNTYVLLNNGTGWNATPDPRWTIGTSTVYSSGGNCYDRGMRFVDVNGDGLPDFVRSYSAVGSAGLPEGGSSQFVYLNTGSGWATSTAYTLPYIINNPSGSTSVTYQELANFQGNGQQYQDVLSTVTYPKGGSTNVTYGYTSQSGTNPQLPYNLLVVTKLVNHDALGSNEETDYAYSGGLQYLPANVFDRKFAGFASVTASTPLATTITYYSQGATSTAIVSGDQSDGYAQIGHPYREDILNPANNNLVQRTFYRWDADTTSVVSTSTFPTSSIAGYWPLDESSGIAHDSTVDGNNLTNNNTVTYASGKINNGASLASASSQYFSIPDFSQTGLGLNSSYTYAGWIKFASLPSLNQYYAIQYKYHCGTYTCPGESIAFGSNSGTYQINAGWCAPDVSGNGCTYGNINWTPTTGVWYHIAVTFNLSTETIQVYINGVPQTVSYVYQSSAIVNDIGERICSACRPS